MTVNFQETFKYLKPHPRLTDTFLLIEPHLLYLNNSQAESYLELMNNPKYAESFHSDTVKIIKRELSQLFPNHLSEMTLIDLGPGYPDKSLPIAEYFKSMQIELDYVPVDVSRLFLDIADQNVKPLVRSTAPIQARFEDCRDHIPERFYQQTAFCMIGLTFMNFPPETFISLLKKIAGKNGAVIIASELLGADKTVEHILASYRNNEARNLLQGPLLNLGFDENMIEYDVQFNDSRVEMGFNLAQIPKGPLESAGLKKGSRVITGISYRYSKEELEKLLQIYFTSAQLFLSDNRGTALALCK